MKILMLTVIFILAFSFLSFADMAIDIEIGKDKLASVESAFIEDGSVFVPLRAVCDALGIYCEWNAETKCAYTSSEGFEAYFYPYRSIAYNNGAKKNLKSRIINGRLMVPIRFLSESHGLSVSWDGVHYRVIIESDTPLSENNIDKTYNYDEVYWLSRIIHAEAGGESATGQIAVGNVVLNRVKSPLFPNTIYSVIFDRSGGVQFEPILNGTIYSSPSYSAVKAAKKALSGVNTAGNSLFFLNPQKAENFWIVANRDFYQSIGNHDFYL